MKKAQKLPETKLNPTELRRQRFVDGLVDGKSMYQAALDAGYAKTTAKVACRDIMPQARDAFRQAMHHRISVGKLSDTIAAGLDAHETKVFSTKTGVVYSEPLVAWGERREYAKLAANLMDMEPDKSVALTGPNGDPLQVEMKLIHFGVLTDGKTTT